MRRKILAAYNILRRRPKVIGLPIHIQVESTNACNLRCATCHRDLLYPKSTMMKFNDFKLLYDEIRPENINVSGLGEPFLNPDIFKMIGYAKESGSAVNCASNFTLVGKKIDQIITSGIDQIKISVDAADAETFLKIRAKDLHDTLTDNIRKLTEAKKKQGADKPALRFNYALQRDNIDQLIDTIHLAAELNIPAIYIQYLEYIDREERKKRLVGNMSPENLKKTLLQVESVADKLGITTNINIWMRDFDIFYNKMRPAEEFIPNSKKCYFPWFTSWVDADGTVRPCPIIPWQREEAHMGNAFKEKFSVIWNNEKYQNLRRALARGERPYGPCKTCIPQGLFNIFQIRTKLLPGLMTAVYIVNRILVSPIAD
jgi:radical SAM protein with 4Fe4S-binding SPASM domain